jgi:hypothetical protein
VVVVVVVVDSVCVGGVTHASDHSPPRCLYLTFAENPRQHNHQELSNLLNGLANLNHQPGDDVLSRVVLEAEAKLTDFNAQVTKDTPSGRPHALLALVLYSAAPLPPLHPPLTCLAFIHTGAGHLRQRAGATSGGIGLPATADLHGEGPLALRGQGPFFFLFCAL